jgi:hypothetical protein
MRLLALHLWSLLATTSMAMMTSMATITTTIATSLAMVDFVGAKSSPWDWQKGTGEYAKFAAYEEELRAMASQPYFSRVTGNVSVRLGETAYLPCRAKDLADSYMVTWMRVADVTVLSVGALTFSSDPRFSVIHVPRPRIRADDWTLVISGTEARDAGRYECSVNTLPKISHTVALAVKEMAMADSPHQEPRVLSKQMRSVDEKEKKELFELVQADIGTGPGPVSSISGPKVQYVSAGSTVGLECRIQGLPSPPLSLYWKRGNRVLTAKERPGISLESEKVPGVSTARLFLSHVSHKDSATYSCVSDLAPPATVQLVVTEDHMRSALVSFSSGDSTLNPSPLFLLLLLFSFLSSSICR